MNYLNIESATLKAEQALCTAREISQQPDCWQRTEALLQAQAPAIKRFLAPLLAQQNLRIILTGAGSSAFIGECLAPLLQRSLGRHVEAIATTDLLSGPSSYLLPAVPTLLVSFGRSGSSPESVAVVELAEQLMGSAYQLVITCNEQGKLYQRCRDRPNSLAILLPPETHDQAFAMTSSFTSMLLAAWLALSGPHTKPADVSRIAAAVRALLVQHNDPLRQLASRDYSRVVYLGSSNLKGLAREAALKLLELTDGRVVAAHDSSLGFRHGPKSIITADTLVIMFLSNDAYTRAYDLDLLRELRTDALAGQVLAVTAQAGDAAVQGSHLLVEQLADTHDGALAFAYVVCAQLYALHRALALGITPDQPSASGAVNRVVSGVTIHAFQS